MTYGERLKKLRKHFGLTLEQFGNRLGVLVKKYGAGNQGTITKVGRLLLADKEGIKL